MHFNTGKTQIFNSIAPPRNECSNLPRIFVTTQKKMIKNNALLNSFPVKFCISLLFPLDTSESYSPVTSMYTCSLYIISVHFLSIFWTYSYDHIQSWGLLIGKPRFQEKKYIRWIFFKKSTCKVAFNHNGSNDPPGFINCCKKEKSVDHYTGRLILDVQNILDLEPQEI